MSYLRIANGKVDLNATFSSLSLTMSDAHLSSLLIVDDSEMDCELVGIACASLGCEIESVTDTKLAIESYREKKHDLVLVSYELEPIDGIELVNRFFACDEHVNIVMMAGHPDDRIFDFLYEKDMPDLLTKPIRPMHLKEQVRIALGRRFGRKPQQSSLALSLKMDHCFPLQGESLEIVRVRKQIADYLKSDERSIIIQGPNGIGKPEVARFIHENGDYGDSEYFYLDCRDLTEAEMEKEFISREGELGAILSADAECTITIGHLEAISPEIQSKFATVFRELNKKFHFIFLMEDSLDSCIDQGSVSDVMAFALTPRVIEIPDLSDRPMDVEAIIRFIFANRDAFDFQPAEDVSEDYLVVTLRRTQLDRNIDEIFERVIGRRCRRIRGELQTRG